MITFEFQTNRKSWEQDFLAQGMDIRGYLEVPLPPNRLKAGRLDPTREAVRLQQLRFRAIRDYLKALPGPRQGNKDGALIRVDWDYHRALQIRWTRYQDGLLLRGGAQFVLCRDEWRLNSNPAKELTCGTTA